MTTRLVLSQIVQFSIERGRRAVRPDCSFGKKKKSFAALLVVAIFDRAARPPDVAVHLARVPLADGLAGAAALARAGCRMRSAVSLT